MPIARPLRKYGLLKIIERIIPGRVDEKADDSKQGREKTRYGPSRHPHFGQSPLAGSKHC